MGPLRRRDALRCKFTLHLSLYLFYFGKDRRYRRRTNPCEAESKTQICIPIYFVHVHDAEPVDHTSLDPGEIVAMPRCGCAIFKIPVLPVLPMLPTHHILATAAATQPVNVFSFLGYNVSTAFQVTSLSISYVGASEAMIS